MTNNDSVTVSEFVNRLQESPPLSPLSSHRISNLIHKLLHFSLCAGENRGELSYLQLVPYGGGQGAGESSDVWKVDKTNNMIDNDKQHTLPSYHHISSRSEDF